MPATGDKLKMWKLVLDVILAVASILLSRGQNVMSGLVSKITR